jgi:hypothetical protein
MRVGNVYAVSLLQYFLGTRSCTRAVHVAHMFTLLGTHMRTCTQTYTQNGLACTVAYITHTHTHTYTHSHTYTHTHAYTHTHTCKHCTQIFAQTHTHSYTNTYYILMYMYIHARPYLTHMHTLDTRLRIIHHCNCRVDVANPQQVVWSGQMGHQKPAFLLKGTTGNVIAFSPPRQERCEVLEV